MLCRKLLQARSYQQFWGENGVNNLGINDLGVLEIVDRFFVVNILLLGPDNLVLGVRHWDGKPGYIKFANREIGARDDLVRDYAEQLFLFTEDYGQHGEIEFITIRLYIQVKKYLYKNSFQMAKQNLFISFTEADAKKVEIIEKALLNNQDFKAVVVARKNTPLKSIVAKVLKPLNNADYVIPILTNKSITQQWIHQEIGFAKAKEIPIIPIVEEDISGLLTAFVNTSLDMPYQFKRFKTNSKRENEIFKSKFLELILDLTSKKRGMKKQPTKTTSTKPITEIEYKTWGGDRYTTIIGELKCFWKTIHGKQILTRVEVPDFLHASEETGATSKDDVINYLSGVNDDEWEAKIKTTIDQNGLVSFNFEHTNRSNHSHPSANIDLKDWNGIQRTILIKSMKPTPASNKQMSFIYPNYSK